MEKLSDFIEKLENGVSYYYATAVIDELTQDERKKIHDMCVVKAAVSMTFPPQRDDLSRVAEYIRQNYIPTNEQPANNQQPNDEQPQLSEGLLKALEKAKQAGFVSIQKGLFCWESTRRDLAFFAVVAHEKGLTNYKWKDIERLFRVKFLAQEDWQATSYTGATPNSKTIKAFFE